MQATAAPFFIVGSTNQGEMVAFNNDPFPQVFVTRVTPNVSRRE